MKFTILPILLAGATLVQTTSAAPIRITITEISHHDMGLGGAKYNSPNDGELWVAHGEDDAGRHHPGKQGGNGKPHHQHGCAGSKLRNKAIDIGNAFRKALGMSLIEKHTHHAHRPHHKGDHKKEMVENHHKGEKKEGLEGLVTIMPFVAGGSEEELKAMVHAHAHGMKHHGHGFHYRKHFMGRLHRALTALGPWEGRAVAFVLGCGIGVLFRMMWVLMVVSYRLIKGGNREQDSVEYAIVFEQDVENAGLVNPPQYSDEKIAILEDSDVKAPVV